MWIYAHHSLSFGWFVIVIVASLPDWDENRKCKPNVKHRGYNWCFDFTIGKHLNCNVYGTESTQLTPSYHNDPKSEFKYFFFLVPIIINSHPDSLNTIDSQSIQVPNQMRVPFKHPQKNWRADPITIVFSRHNPLPFEFVPQTIPLRFIQITTFCSRTAHTHTHTERLLCNRSVLIDIFKHFVCGIFFLFKFKIYFVSVIFVVVLVIVNSYRRVL